MGLMEELGKAAGELENAADDAINKAKAKYNEKVTPEKKQEIRDKADSAMKAVEDAAEKIGAEIEKGLKSFSEGYDSAKHKEK
ncbi:MAG: hypothetical protein IJT87_07770 [Ruminiclostridium sp.]|nr:hypothetical protein [Ruminiclostridium sp.]